MFRISRRRREMMRSLMATALAVAMSASAPSRTPNKHAVPSQSEGELIALSRKAVDDCVGKEIAVVDDATPQAPSGMAGSAAVRGKFHAVELADTKIRIDGDLAVVVGRVVFKGGPPEWQAKESSHDVIIRFSSRKGRWEFVGLCMGRCAAG